MPNTTARVAFSVIGLVVGIVIGILIRTTFVPRIGAGPIIFVGPRAGDLSLPRAKISKGHHEVVAWIGTAKDSTGKFKDLRIEFQDPIFDNMTHQSNGRWLVDCQGHQCFSGPIAASTDYKDYKYWQILIDSGGNREEADGIIIIDR